MDYVRTDLKAAHHQIILNSLSLADSLLERVLLLVGKSYPQMLKSLIKTGKTSSEKV